MTKRLPQAPSFKPESREALLNLAYSLFGCRAVKMPCFFKAGIITLTENKKTIGFIGSVIANFHELVLELFLMKCLDRIVFGGRQ